MTEAKFLDKLAHPNIVQFTGICLEEGGIIPKYMVFDVSPCGVNIEVHNLSDLVNNLSRPNCCGYQKLIMEATQAP